MLDLVRSGQTRFTNNPANDGFPVWSPDGKRLIFTSNRNGTGGDIYDKDTGGGGQELVRFQDKGRKLSQDWSDDGRFLLYEVVDPKTSRDLWVLPLQGDPKQIAFAVGQNNQTQGQFSPGPGGTPRWIAYSSDESGTFEIYVDPFPAATTEHIHISTGGGTRPRWRRDGKELYYIAPDGKLMAVEVKIAPRFEHGPPKALFDTNMAMDGARISAILWSPSPDGKRFLIMTRGEESAASEPVTVVVNWQAAAKR
jgi:Tol biopolymer transport system component